MESVWRKIINAEAAVPFNKIYKRMYVFLSLMQGETAQGNSMKFHSGVAPMGKVRNTVLGS